MIRVETSMPGGDNLKMRWLNDRIEDAALAPPYALIVAGASFHWMRPDIALRRFSEVISPNGMFAISKATHRSMRRGLRNNKPS